ncbi:MAG: preprotein translocase subunit SecG [bacterium]
MQQFLNTIAPYLLPAQVICLILATILILMQNRGSGLSSSFGGSNEIYLTRRGIEKWVVNFTVILLVLFVILRVLSLYI